MKNRTVMVGITTSQNTTNAIPVIQLKASDYLPINTGRALKEGWNNGLMDVLTSRGISVHEGVFLNNKESTNVKVIVDKVKFALMENGLWDYPILWNIGGGQKIHQLALWFLYQQRRKKNDKLVYAEPFSGTLSIIEYDSDIRQNIMVLRSDFTIEELLKIYKNLEVVEGEHRIGIKRDKAWAMVENRYKVSGSGDVSCKDEIKSVFRKSVENVLKDYQARSRFDVFWNRLKSRVGSEIAKRDKKCKYYVDTIFEKTDFKTKIRNSYDNKRFSPKAAAIEIESIVVKHLQGLLNNSKGNVFEKGVQGLVFDYIRMFDPNRSFFVDVGFNIKVEDPKNPGNVIAEYDTLIATSKGTLLSFDAKVGFQGQKAKDWLARRLRIERAGGIYAKWIAVIPERFFNDNESRITELYKSIKEECEIVVVSRRKDEFLLPDLSERLPSLKSYFRSLLSTRH